MIGIYKITNPECLVYIGESKNIKNRFNSYKYLKCKTQRKLYNSFLKYGVENHKFEVLMECEIEDLKYFESCFQQIYRVIENGLNLKITGRFEVKGLHSFETKAKQSQSMKIKYKNGYESPHKGMKRSIETKNRISESAKGRKKKSESIEKQRQSMINKYKNGYLAPMQGKKFTEIHKEKLSKNNASSKKVINAINGFFYDSAKECYFFNKDLIKVQYRTFCGMLNGWKKNNTNFTFI